MYYSTNNSILVSPRGQSLLLVLSFPQSTPLACTILTSCLIPQVASMAILKRSHILQISSVVLIHLECPNKRWKPLPEMNWASTSKLQIWTAEVMNVNKQTSDTVKLWDFYLCWMLNSSSSWNCNAKVGETRGVANMEKCKELECHKTKEFVDVNHDQSLSHYSCYRW